MKKNILYLILILILINQLIGCENTENTNDGELDLVEEVILTGNEEEIDAIEENPQGDLDYANKLNLVTEKNRVLFNNSYFFNDVYYIDGDIAYGIYEYNIELNTLSLKDNRYGKNLNIYKDSLIFIDNTDLYSPTSIAKSSLVDENEVNHLGLNSNYIGHYRGVDNLTVVDQYAYFIEGRVSSPGPKDLYRLNLDNGETVVIMTEEKIYDFQIIDNEIYVLTIEERESEIFKLDSITYEKKSIVKFDKSYSSFTYISEDEILMNGDRFKLYNLTTNESFIFEKDEVMINYNIFDNKLIYTIRVYEDDESEYITKVVDLDTKEEKILDKIFYDFSVLNGKLLAYLVTDDQSAEIYTEELVVLDSEFIIIEYVSGVKVD